MVNIPNKVTPQPTGQGHSAVYGTRSLHNLWDKVTPQPMGQGNSTVYRTRSPTVCGTRSLHSLWDRSLHSLWDKVIHSLQNTITQSLLDKVTSHLMEQGHPQSIGQRIVNYYFPFFGSFSLLEINIFCFPHMVWIVKGAMI